MKEILVAIACQNESESLVADETLDCAAHGCHYILLEVELTTRPPISRSGDFVTESRVSCLRGHAGRTKETTPEHGEDISRPHVGRFAWRGVSLPLGFTPAAIGERSRGSGGRRVGDGSDRWRGSPAHAPCVGARDHHGRTAVRRPLKNHGGVCRAARRTFGVVHRSAHSSSVVVPRRAASTVGYRAQAAARPAAEPRFIVAISLNIL